MDGDTFNEPRSKDKRSKRYVVFEVTPRGERSAVGHGYLKEACRLLNKGRGGLSSNCQVAALSHGFALYRTVSETPPFTLHRNRTCVDGKTGHRITGTGLV
jgi:hypothetical protein